MGDPGRRRAALLCAVPQESLDHLPRKPDDHCLPELRWPHDRRDVAEAGPILPHGFGKWSAPYPRLTSWVEETIECTLIFLLPPAPAPDAPLSPPKCWNANEEIRPRIHAVRIFLKRRTLPAPVRALAVETNKTGWGPTAAFR
ncbi:hypothetical protein FJ949_23940 [Mesorhizobium sp. B2-4-1]|uniref:transposase n=1 Tax=Mesorhizobium sp. BR-1-1-8 TaxID=2876659 RepID=UPI0011277C6C|nr:hypothetical protein FJ947_22420 [Mesorhizobium sp. B2-4-8]TPL61228.1 hypothetical protein FJ949_23940 [Mesorhizobium sp. B2-4-1]TPM98699.1 hypothetical protein FJ966_11465 [Mesorhizobium sp. B2-1-5]